MTQEAVVLALKDLGEVNEFTLYTTGRLVINGSKTTIDTNISGFIMRTPQQDAEDRLLPENPKSQMVGTVKRSEAEVAKPRRAESTRAEIIKESSKPKGNQLSPQKAKRKVPEGIDGFRPSKSLGDGQLDHARTLIDLKKSKTEKKAKALHSEDKSETESQYVPDDDSTSEDVENNETESGNPEIAKTAPEVQNHFLKRGILSLKSFNDMLKPRIINDQKVLTMPISSGHTKERDKNILRAVLCVPIPEHVERSKDGHYFIQRSHIFGAVYLMDVDLKKKLPYSPSKFEELSGIRARKWHSSFKMDLNDASVSGRPVRLWLDALQVSSMSTSS
jgi:hypothetical protein